MVKLNKRATIFLNNIYLDYLTQYYNSFTNIDEIISIIQSKNKISLRLIDWVVTKYTKFNLTLLHDNKNELFNVYISYKSQLKVYTKKFFDPFKRGLLITYKFNNGKEIKTTVGQLMFFKWIYENNIYTFIENNRENLINKMNNYYLFDKKNKIIKGIHKKESKEIKSDNQKQVIKCFVINL